jgi:hypothetical protein
MVTGPPTRIPVTNPEPETVATALFDELQVTTRPVSTAPEASRVVAESCTTAKGVRDGDAGETLTVATGGGVTVTVADPSCPSLVATIVTGPPMVTAVTSPVEETVATAVFVELHVTVRLARVPPWASRGVAVSCTVPPTMTDDDGGETRTDATGGGGSVPPLQAATTVRHAARIARRTPRRGRFHAFFRGRADAGVWTRGTTFMELL